MPRSKRPMHHHNYKSPIIIISIPSKTSDGATTGIPITTTTTTTAFTMLADSPPPICLQSKEKMLFDRLLEVVSFYNLGSTLRVAGGWVRDKLLGKDSHDIDIAIVNLLGKTFADKVTDYLISMGEEVKRAHSIKSNPEKSKHLQTSNMPLYGMKIDFVNLRSEDYCRNSRIPDMVFGAAEEDAFAKGLDNKQLVLQHQHQRSGRFYPKSAGIVDLNSGMIATPLPPKQTFLDDPFHVLRAVHFGTRFEFTSDKALEQAAACDEVRAAIRDKISWEPLELKYAALLYIILQFTLYFSLQIVFAFLVVLLIDTFLVQPGARCYDKFR